MAETTTILVERLVKGYVRPYFGKLFFAVICMILGAAATAANAWMMQPILDDVFLKRDPQMLILVPLAVLVIAIIKGVTEYGQAVLMSFVGQRIITDIQKKMYAHLMRADIAFFHDNATGGLISRFVSDVLKLRIAVSSVLTGIIKDSLTLIFLLTLMFMRDWQLALIAFVVFPLAVFPILRIGRRIRKISTSTQAETGQFSTLLNQTFQGARHVKAYGMEGHETERAGTIIEKIFKLSYKSAKVSSIARPVIETLGGVAVALVVWYGGSQVISGETTPGAFFSFITALLLAYQPVKNLAKLNASLQEGLAAAQRVFALLDVEPEIKDKPDAGHLPDKVAGAISFHGVRFSYGHDVLALDDITIDVPAGKTVALVGPSGGGKSTILNLIPRFYDVGEGAIKIDNIDIRDVTISSLRGNIALVSQEISLFDDTVGANIAYGRLGASNEEIETAAQQAAADDFIKALPEGYDPLVGENGVRLSGGQRQRIAIARAMLKNAPILLLDEATSALDTQSERQVQKALKELMKGRTTLVIAHRLSTIVDADLIYVISEGKVIESGAHGDLLRKNGAYARLCALQFTDSNGEKAESGPNTNNAGPRATPATKP
ncbi:MAG: lipid A export permease/ATP-binding protein MsbA [Rhodospirillaceae bacterium]|nr:lipid A export permease/ATP-binding protein MsbA [Rhodospirillaceae bacterium]